MKKESSEWQVLFTVDDHDRKISSCMYGCMGWASDRGRRRKGRMEYVFFRKTFRRRCIGPTIKGGLSKGRCIHQEYEFRKSFGRKVYSDPQEGQRFHVGSRLMFDQGYVCVCVCVCFLVSSSKIGHGEVVRGFRMFLLLAHVFGHNLFSVIRLSLNRITRLKWSQASRLSRSATMKARFGDSWPRACLHWWWLKTGDHDSRRAN